MFRNILIILLFIFFSGFTCYASTGNELNESIKNLSQRIDVLEYKLPLGFEEKLSSQKNDLVNEITSISSLGISEQQKLISQQQTGLAIFGIIFTLVSVFLGWYITWISKKIKKSENSAKKIEDEIESTLKGKTNEFYQRIQDADTDAIFKRLKEYPEEILNVFPMLATRKIPEIHFSFLKQQTIQYADDFTQIGLNYKMLMLQHFCAQMLIEESLINIIKKDFNILIINCFQKEINDMFEEIANRYVKNENNENYLWFLRVIKRFVSEEKKFEIEFSFKKSNKIDLWKNISEDIIENS